MKSILITGSTDGIGLAAARVLVGLGHHVLVHGRDPAKLEAVEKALAAAGGGGRVDGVVADLSRLSEVEALARSVAERIDRLDVLINNAGVFAVRDPITSEGYDVRFVVNAIAPYLLTQRLLPLIGSAGRIVNLSSAAQSSVDLPALDGEVRLPDNAAYAQSKLTLTMWSNSLARSLGDRGPTITAVNPGSLLGTKMVKEAFGHDGADVGIGAEVLRRAALDEDFAAATGRYFDNDSGAFGHPHPDALDRAKCDAVVAKIEAILAERER